MDQRGVDLNYLLTKKWYEHVESNFEKGIYAKPRQFLVSPFLESTSFFKFVEQPRSAREHEINLSVLHELAEAYNILLDYIDRCKETGDTKYYTRAGNASDAYLRFLLDKCGASQFFTNNNRVSSVLCQIAYKKSYGYQES